jgi:hypothetical protein
MLAQATAQPYKQQYRMLKIVQFRLSMSAVVKTESQKQLRDMKI